LKPSLTSGEVMELRHLRYFIAVAEELHFGRAAQRLRITQPPLSFQIQSLERELGVQLFIRGRTIELTESGRVFLDEARLAIDAADSAARAAQKAGRSTVGQVRVGYPAMTVSDLVPTALRTFQERRPDVAVEPVVAHTGAHLEALRAGELDVAFICGGVAGNELHFRSLHQEPFLLAMPEDHPLARRRAVPMEQLAGEPIVLFPRSLEPSLYYYLLTDVLGRCRVAPMVALEATTVQSTYSAVAAGIGVAFSIESTTRIVDVPGVAHRAFASPPPLFRHSVAWRAGTMAATVRDFLAILEEIVAARAVRPNGSNGNGNGRPRRRRPIPLQTGTPVGLGAEALPVVAALAERAAPQVVPGPLGL
jgi:DNA-binding transcriptional LysR family regulator